MNSNSLIKIGPLSRCKFSSVLGDYPRHPADKFRPEHAAHLMQLGGLAEEASPEEVCALAAIDHRGKEEAVERAKEFFMTYACMVPTGLPELPEPWLLGLTNILWGLRQPHWHRLPFFISRLEMQEGALLLQFAQELREPEPRITIWDRIRFKVNACLYPSRWRKLKPRDQVRILNVYAFEDKLSDAAGHTRSARRTNAQRF
jgi:hypothetical protein